MKNENVRVKHATVMLVACMAMVFYACHSDEGTAPILPVVSTLMPSEGPVGTEVSVQGVGFGTTPSSLAVTFNGVKATIKSTTDVLLVVTVPDLATTGPVAVTVNGTKVTGPVFTVTKKSTPAAITSLNPSQGPVGTQIRIKGTSFGSIATNLAVTFNGVAADIVSAYDTELVVTVPALATTGVVVVTVNGSVITGPVFTVTETPVVVSSISPTRGPKETEVTIIGTGFGTNAGENIVTFNGKPAEVTLATATTLKAQVPVGAATGVVKVTRGTQTAEGPVFTYDYTAVVSTLAGSGMAASIDGVNAMASFDGPHGLAIDGDGNIIVSEFASSRIRKISTAGQVTTIAGSTNGYAEGQGTAAKFYQLREVKVDRQGNLLVADYLNLRIREVQPTGNVLTLAGNGMPGFADGASADARFSLPSGIAVASDNTVYVADEGNHRIRKIVAGNVTTLAGNGTANYADGQGSNAMFSGPVTLAIDADNNLYTSDFGGAHIRKITPGGLVTTVAGSGAYGYQDGVATEAKFNKSRGVAVDAAGNIYVADTDNNCIRKISNGVVTTIAGSTTEGYADGNGSEARFSFPTGIVVDASGALYVADYRNSRIRKISFE
ncbi:IPT/TIG domain-containing protein [Chryseolinea lacunae]|uniref:IPT/TIG domain-containing protein n=1 Tax=Chryseolinea lacunae TaxID=2801331 RepID=A0ABS1KTZ3_9BACT|nr:IPT/TIG domain-containing protein [Chryseolinea lacunae]MBL0742930.1 IPT/TIG domain-containing protein [Chryseolinea lacunae]